MTHWVWPVWMSKAETWPRTPELTTLDADDVEVTDDDAVARRMFADGDVSADRPPQRLAGLPVEGENLTVDGVVVDVAFGVLQTTGLGAAAGLKAMLTVNVRAELPQDVAVVVEVERQHFVRRLARAFRLVDRRDDVHGVADHERRGLILVENAELHRPGNGQISDVAEIDLVKQ